MIDRHHHLFSNCRSSWTIFWQGPIQRRSINLLLSSHCNWPGWVLQLWHIRSAIVGIKLQYLHTVEKSHTSSSKTRRRTLLKCRVVHTKREAYWKEHFSAIWAQSTISSTLQESTEDICHFQAILWDRGRQCRRQDRCERHMQQNRFGEREVHATGWVREVYRVNR